VNRLEELIVFVVDRAKKEGKQNLSRFEVLKIIYLLQVYSLKYAGTSLLPGITFIREKNGPISVDIYNAMDNLVSGGYLNMEVIENEKYGHPRHAFSLKKKAPKLNFDQGEEVFLDGFLIDLLTLSQKNLKDKAYSTEPMETILKSEKGGKVKKGEVLDFSSVSVDSDVVDAYSDAI